MSQWYYKKNGQEFGPIDSATLKLLAEHGGLLPGDAVRQEGKSETVPAARLKGLFPTPSKQATPPSPPPSVVSTRPRPVRGISIAANPSPQELSPLDAFVNDTSLASISQQQSSYPATGGRHSTKPMGRTPVPASVRKPRNPMIWIALGIGIVVILALGITLPLILGGRGGGGRGNEQSEKIKVQNAFSAVCKSGTAQQVRASIEGGANVNASINDESLWTPLMEAARNNPNPDVIVTLVKAGAKVNAITEKSRTPIFFAAQNPNPDVVAALIQAGADVNVADEPLEVNGSLEIWLGDTPLMWAAEWNENPKTIEVLLKAGADINAKGRFGKTPLMFAAQSNKNVEVINLLVRAGSGLGYQGEGFGSTPLSEAARFNDNPQVIAALIQAGCDVNARDIKNGRTPLTEAAEDNKNPEVISVLVKYGATINAPGRDGMTPLMIAAVNKNIAAFNALMKAGADVNARGARSYPGDSATPLMMAAKGGDLEIIKQLINSGAELKAKNSSGKSVLDYARDAGNSKAVTLLIKSGAE